MLYNFILTSYKKTIANSSSYFKAISADIFNKHIHPYIHHILKSSTITLLLPSTTLIKVRLKDLHNYDDELILGYSVANGDTLHIVFIKRLYRREGLSPLLLPEDFKYYTTFLNKQNKKIYLDLFKDKQVKFNPYSL